MSKSFVLATLLLLVLFFAVPRSGRAEDGFDLLLNAIDTQETLSPVLTGRGDFDLTITPGEKSEEEIQKEIEEVQAIEELIHRDDPNRERLLYEDIPRSVRSRYTEKKHLSGTFQFDYSKEGVEYAKESQIPETGKKSNPEAVPDENGVVVINANDLPSTLIERRETSKGGRPKAETAHGGTTLSSVVVSDTLVDIGRFSHFGRLHKEHVLLLNSLVKQFGGISGAKEKLNAMKETSRENGADSKLFEIVETKPFEGGAESFIIESSVDGKVTERYAIVPALGYVCPLIQRYNDGKPSLEYIASDYVRDEKSGLYYPLTYEESFFEQETGNLASKRVYKIKRETLALNEPMSPEDFALDVSEKQIVVDKRGGRNESYTADTPGRLTLAPHGLDLKKQSWLTKRSVKPCRSEDAAKSGGYARIVLIAVGILLVLVGVLTMIRKKMAG